MKFSSSSAPAVGQARRRPWIHSRASGRWLAPLLRECCLRIRLGQRDGPAQIHIGPIAANQFCVFFDKKCIGHKLIVIDDQLFHDKYIKSSQIVESFMTKNSCSSQITDSLNLVMKILKSSNNSLYSVTFLTSVIIIFVTDTHFSCSACLDLGTKGQLGN